MLITNHKVRIYDASTALDYILHNWFYLDCVAAICVFALLKVFRGNGVS